jgi:tetratricopeptide (TPR) repeat protein
MKIQQFFLCTLTIIVVSCSTSTNNEAFIKKTTGRYLFNSDEILEVYFDNQKLFLKWRGASSIEPLSVGEKTFFVKEMNEKIQFLTNPENQLTYMVLVPKTESDTLQYNFRKLKQNEKIPSEYLKNNNFEKAMEGYLKIKKIDSLDSSLNENNFNDLGYKELRDKNYKQALNIFKINMELYPASSNVYDSYADALKVSGDTLEAIKYYKKSLAIDSGNRNAKRFVEKYDKKE